jgi:hypothetical protein
MGNSPSARSVILKLEVLFCGLDISGTGQAAGVCKMVLGATEGKGDGGGGNCS